MGFSLKSLGAIGAVVNPVSLFANAAAVGGDIYSAYAENRAQKDANAANQLQAREQMQFSAGQASAQMAFQERMSSTAHQREVADLKAAGLNPLLSVNSGASTPGGASGSSAGYTAVANPAGRYLASAREGKLFREEVKSVQAGRYNTEVDSMRKITDNYNANLSGEGLRLENDLMRKRNKFFEENPKLFKLHLMSSGLSSAAGAARLVVPGVSYSGKIK